jgi:hypothetical protein
MGKGFAARASRHSEAEMEVMWGLLKKMYAAGVGVKDAGFTEADVIAFVGVLRNLAQINVVQLKQSETVTNAITTDVARR